MLYEFALEPEAMTSWHNVQLISNLFGVEHARLISKFPSKWQREVIEACNRKRDLRDMEKARIVERIRQLGPKIVPTGRTYNPLRKWLDNAETEHTLRPFRAIISNSNPRGHSFVLDPDTLDETVRLWNVPRETKVPREPHAMASCVSLLFLLSRSIFFVDPYFKPEASRFIRPLVRFLRDISDISHRSGRTFDRIEYHLEFVCSCEFFVGECRKSLVRHVPNGIEIIFCRWRQRKPGEDLHPRYVLTDVGGFRFDNGLDDGEPGEMTDVGPLSHYLYSKRWNDFQQIPISGMSTTYELVDRIRIIGGEGVEILP